MKRLFFLLTNFILILSLFGCSSVNNSTKYPNPLLQDSNQFTKENNTNSDIKSKTYADTENQNINQAQTDSDTASNSQVQSKSTTLTSFTNVANYILEHGELPENYITKSQASAQGWVAKKGNLAEIAPGKSIGGDVFTNSEWVLPDAPGRVWYEADIDYTSGFRNSKRIVFSNDGLVYKTVDHYKTFSRIK